MKTYFADTNFFIRYFIGDVKEQQRTAFKYLKKARDGKVKIKVVFQVLAEIEYVLRKVYKTPRDKIAEHIQSLLKSDYLEFENRTAYVDVFELYKKVNIDLVDLLIVVLANREEASILSFDKKLKKLAKI